MQIKRKLHIVHIPHIVRIAHIPHIAQKKLSRLLALVLMMSLMVPILPIGPILSLLPVVSVYAALPPAPYSINGALHMGLDKGTGDPTATGTGIDSSSTHVLLDWLLPKNLSDGMYVLRYYKADRRKVELTLQFISDTLVVNYNVYKYDDTRKEYININHPEDGDKKSGSNVFTESDLQYKIYGVAGVNQNDYVSAKDYFLQGMNYTGDDTTRANNYDPYVDTGNGYVPIAAPDTTGSLPPRNQNDYVFNNDRSHFADLANRLAPSFNVNKDSRNGKGFYFRYDGSEAGFFYKGQITTEGRFYLDISDILYGYVYDFQLEYYGKNDVRDYVENLYKTSENGRDNSNVAYKDVHYVFAGFDSANISIIPFAETDNAQKPYNTLEDFLDNADVAKKESASAYRYAPDYYNTDHLDLAAGDLPGTGNVGLDLRMDLPKVFDIKEHTYGGNRDQRTDINLSLFNLRLEIGTIDAANPANQKKCTVVIPKFVSTKEYPSSQTDNGAPDATLTTSAMNHQTELKDVSLLTRVTNGASASSPDRLRIRLDNLGPGLAFTRKIVEIFRSADAASEDFAKWTIHNGALAINRSIYTFLRYELIDSPNGQMVTFTPYNSDASVNSPYEGTYALNWLPGFKYNSSDVNEAYFEASSNDEQLRFSLISALQDPTDRVYGITFERVFDEPERFLSQIFNYTPVFKKPTVGVPNGFEIYKESDKAYMLRPKEDFPDGSQGTLTFWAKWDIGLESHIHALLDETVDDKMTITYELGTSLDANGFEIVNPGNAADRIMVDVTIERDGTDLVFTYQDNKGFIKDPETGQQPVVTSVPLKHLDLNTLTNLLYVEIPFVADAANTEVELDPPTFFQYPNIYYFKVIPDTLTRNVKSSIPTNELINPNLRGAVPSSRVQNITLDDLMLSRREVPPLSKFSLTAESDSPAIKANYTVPGAAIAEYIKSQYAFGPEVWVNIYLSQFEQNITGDLTYDAANTTRAGTPYRTVSYSDLYEADGLLNLGNHPDALATLRGQYPTEKVLCIEKVPLMSPEGRAYDIDQTMAELNRDLRTSLLLSGLDPNQQYYAAANVTVKQWEDDTYEDEILDANGVPIAHSSILTGRAGATTTDGLNIPGLSEKVPTAPNLSVVEGSVTQASATLAWNNLAYTVGEAEDDVVIEYEIIRIKGQQMPESIFEDPGSNTDIDRILDALKTPDIMAWRTNGDRIDRLYPTADTDMGGYIKNVNGITFTDGTLQPNQVYFYYIRTQRMIKDGDDPPNYSSWDHETVTTLPIQSPYNLKILTGEDYDHQTEVVINFDIPAIDLALEKIGADYNIELQLKAGSEEWGPLTKMDLSQLTNPANYLVAPDGNSINFTYKISNLTPNTLYLIRLRLYDENTKVGSLYSETKSFKTDVDMDIYEDERKLAEWLEYLKKLLTALLTDPYWTARETASELVVVYRPGDLFQGLLSATYEATMLLYTNKADRVTYYIPATALQGANDANKGFRATYDDLDVLLSPKAINASYNDAVSTMADHLAKKEVSDYFVKLSITRSRVNGLIEGEAALGKQTAVAIELVGIKPDKATNIQAWDDKMYEQFAKVLDDKMKNLDLRSELMDRIQKDTVSRDMLDHVEQLVNDNKADILKKVYEQLSTGSNGILSTHTATVTQLNAPMILVAKGLGEVATVAGYQLQQSVWMPRTVNQYYNGQGIAATTPGTYAFTGHTISIPGMDETLNGGTMSTLVAKYGLDDYLGRDGIDLQQSASRLMVAGCVARLAGAPKTADPITWISANLNMTLSSRNTTGKVQTQEALAMVMALYEKKTGTKVSSIVIRNYTATANMTGLDKRYTQAVRAAFELGLVSDTSLRPTGAVTTGALLEMLAALDNKIKL